MEIEEKFQEYDREYASLSVEFRRQVSLGEYRGIKYRDRPREFHMGNHDLGCKTGKMDISPFDGEEKSSTKV
jgi:hypothetical protein